MDLSGFQFKQINCLTFKKKKTGWENVNSNWFIDDNEEVLLIFVCESSITSLHLKIALILLRDIF